MNHIRMVCARSSFTVQIAPAMCKNRGGAKPYTKDIHLFQGYFSPSPLKGGGWGGVAGKAKKLGKPQHIPNLMLLGECLAVYQILPPQFIAPTAFKPSPRENTTHAAQLLNFHKLLKAQKKGQH